MNQPLDVDTKRSLLGRKAQLAFVVADLDAALRYWTETMKVGPFIVIQRSVGDRKVVHRGRPTNMDMVLAFSYIGDLQIELVQQTNDGPSPYREFLEAGKEGLHHVAFWPDDFEGACMEMEGSGFEEVCSMYLPDGQRNVVYYDTPTHIGTLVELVPMTVERAAYFGRIKKLADCWDGTRPVRRFESRQAFLDSGEGSQAFFDNLKRSRPPKETDDEHRYSC